VQHTKLVRTIM